MQEGVAGTRDVSALLPRLPIALQKPIERRVRYLVVDDPALAQHSFPEKAQALERPGRRDVARIDVGLDAIEREFVEAELQKCPQRLVHVPVAPCVVAQFVTDFGAPALVVEMKQDATADDRLIVDALEPKPQNIAGGDQSRIARDELRRLFKRGQWRRTRLAHHVRIGADRQDRRRVARAQRPQQQAIGAQGEPTKLRHRLSAAQVLECARAAAIQSEISRHADNFCTSADAPPITFAASARSASRCGRPSAFAGRASALTYSA